MSCRLAIVIPAWKEQFFFEALSSIERQSCRDFRLYIGDDASPGKLQDIVNGFTGRIDFVYKRFEENLGQKDLPGQWERCIGLIGSEDYIWLFSDDDIMPEKGIELFYKAIADHGRFDLYRFNIRQIDKGGDLISDRTNHPDVESTEEFIYRRLKGETLSAACEYIFSRNAYNEAGGFVSFPLAWCTDDASWYLFGKNEGICTIPGEPVLWRISETNISKPEKENGQKYLATLLFHLWIKKQNISTRVLNTIPSSLRRQIKILNINLSLFSKRFGLLLNLIGFQESFKIFLFLVKRRFRSYNFR
jgi:glycosyltransferase involved in cell wall biosynthesis